jgi:hypothetical protein
LNKKTGLLILEFILLLCLLFGCMRPTEYKSTPMMSNSPSMSLSTSSPVAQTSDGIIAASFQDGPFQFDIELYHDSGFSKTPIMAWQYSDVSGTGLSISWVYHGQKIESPFFINWGTCKSTYSSEIFHSMEEGSNSISQRGIFLHEQGKVGDREVFAYEIVNGQSSYGGLICFTLQEAKSGFSLSDVVINELHSTRTDCTCGK